MTTTALSALARVATALQDGLERDDVLRVLDAALVATFGAHRLFTVLFFDAAKHRLGRVYSSDHVVNPIGFMKRVTQSYWADQVLHKGNCLLGSTRDDLKKVFPEYETLWAIGCHSFLNIAIRRNGATVGTLNLLGAERLYDTADLGVAGVFAQLAVAPVLAFGDELRNLPDRADMQSV